MLVRAMVFLLNIFMLTSCGQGWIVSGIEVTPSDTSSNTVFIEILDKDSVVHWYHGTIYEDSNWCYRHDELEDIRIK